MSGALVIAGFVRGGFNALTVRRRELLNTSLAFFGHRGQNHLCIAVREALLRAVNSLLRSGPIVFRHEKKEKEVRKCMKRKGEKGSHGDRSGAEAMTSAGAGAMC